MADTHRSNDAAPSLPSSPPLELGDLSQGIAEPSTAGQRNETEVIESGRGREGDQTTSAVAQDTQSPSSVPQQQTQDEQEARDRSPAPLPQPINTSAPPMTRQNSEAIGPPTELPTPMLQVPPTTASGSPVIQFTLLLASTGTRHPFQVNEKYLTKRNVKATGVDGKFDPSTISVYNLKELILKDWRDDWDMKPSSPSAIRLIFFGQLLSDNVSLKECKLQQDGTPNVLHITVKPQEALDDEEAGKGKASMSRDRDGSGSTPGCRCVIL